ncbi:FixH family protein [Hyphomonas sp.]|uniref:FixH family protein n=1 Tax=Hyphomonas sp. TaxID=87 RepID=UPI003001836D|tara:strand:+ start:2139 stop:2651 length:513 start_codon:yes stop_codon:yes gene_type:complete
MTDQTMMADETAPRGKLTGWHVLWIMLGFFGLMFTVNGIFLYHAITSFPGEDVKKSYLQGLDYNSALEAKAAQELLGWNAAAGLYDENLVFNLVDADGNPISARLVSVELRHPGSTTYDESVVLESYGSGDYVTSVSELPTGRWDAQFQVFDPTGEKVVFRANKRIVIVP